MLNKADTKPVIFHSMWRTSSTYFFALFRAKEKYCTYYEPFHEKLSNIEDALKPIQEPSHPILEKPYFHEYQSLNVNNRAKYFDSRFSYLQNLWPEFDSKCKSYIDNLTKEATLRKKTPFLQFNRSFLCMEHFKNFQSQALNAYFYRNPRSQFVSYENAGKVYYIGLSYLQFASEARRNGSTALHFVNVPFYYSQRSFHNTLAFYKPFTSLSVVTSYYIFFCLWCIGLINAIRLDFPCVDVDSKRSKYNHKNGVLDFFEREFPHLCLQDYNPKSYNLSKELSEVYLAVERLVILHLSESDYLPYTANVQTYLASSLNDWKNSTDPQAGLLRKISAELRTATDLNFARIADGLSLNING